MRRALHRVIFSALVLSFVAALFAVPAARAAEPLKIGTATGPATPPGEVAIQKGWFKEAGVEASSSSSSTAPASTPSAPARSMPSPWSAATRW